MGDAPAVASQATTEEPSIKFLTFNTWGLKYVSKHRKQRLNSIADRLATDKKYQFDIIALQEVWCEEDWEYFKSKLSNIFPYTRYFSSGIIAGPGLAILSKIPIESTFLYRFPINGRPSAFFRGDWFVGKSISVTILKKSKLNSMPIAVLNSHMHAPYSATGDAAYDCHRACQAWDFAKLSKMLSKAGYAVIVVGDLNSKPGSLPFNLITKESGLHDSWDVLIKNRSSITGEEVLSDLQISQLNPEQQIDRAATTCDSVLNSWRAHLPSTKACRLDYILINTCLEPIEAEVKFTEKIPDIGSYSDHFAYYCQLKISDSAAQKNIEMESKNSLFSRIENIEKLRALISSYEKETILSWKQLKWRALHVIFSLIIIIGFHIMVPFTSSLASWSSVLIVFGTFVVSVLATTNFFIVALFLPKEWRALEEVKMEAGDMELSLKETIEEITIGSK
ncbi:inositol phosphosphingolipid phospholipase [Saccharomycopsis crataegensis]|uniref:Inositol phosphosphingolipid phospholipase n=1 Tax=Saccharomycopsis crataegensis TaxID=43959 RepID=A0AAV5QQX9_9ASCO|nr:inositol phosphosphingolipid phospholipase [Saccharomycopsis crataegensis]